MRIYDRLYGEMKFPSIITSLLDCPGLLRLRDVRMANNQFVAFPAFASTTRYEHSLGVCYLAGVCAASLGLNEKDTLELMIAGLYHDVGTPPFAHAMEEVLQAKFAFDHEQNLKNLIIGTTDEALGSQTQVYCDEGLKLESVCQSKKAREIGLDRHRIARIIAGEDAILSTLLNSSGMDLDNIDNIIRATSAMGIIKDFDVTLALRLANAFSIFEGQIYYNTGSLNDIRKWQQIRDIQYTAIFDSVEDFSYQTMIKAALHALIEEEDSPTSLSVRSWKLTDSEVVHNNLLKNPKTREIMRRVLMCRPYNCLGILYVKGENISSYINSNLEKIESVSGNFYREKMGVVKDNGEEKDKYSRPVLANFYPDKRKRQLSTLSIFWSSETAIDSDAEYSPGALLGLFTPLGRSSYDGKKDARKSIAFTKSDFLELKIRLAESLFTNYEVSIYRSTLDGQSTTNDQRDQLGLF